MKGDSTRPADPARIELREAYESDTLVIFPGAMRHIIFLSICLTLSGCSLFRPRPPHAALEEAAQYRFPVVFPEQEQQVVPGITAAAITLAMEDFLPLWICGSSDK